MGIHKVGPRRERFQERKAEREERQKRSSQKLNLLEVAELAMKIVAAHERAAELDAGFDAGEFSGRAHDLMMEKGITVLAQKHGFTYDEVMDKLQSEDEKQQEKRWGA